MKTRLFTLLLVLCFLMPGAQAEAPVIADVGLDLLGCSVHYPQITGLPDPDVQAALNDSLMAAGQISDRLDRMARLAASPVKLTVTYETAILGDVLSCVFLADGAVTSTLQTQVWTAAAFDLRTGEAVPFDALFADPDAARAHIEAYLDETVVPGLSAHLAAGSLTPLPEVWAMSGDGLTLYYPIDRFHTLSDKAGTVLLRWHELDGLLAPWLAEITAPEAATAASLTALIADGSLPGIPASLDEPMQPLIDRHALLTDPDLYEGGRMIALESDAFRQAWLLTDALTEGFDASVVQGIRADRLALGDIITGKTTQTEWRAALGDPASTLAVDPERAELWRLVPGMSDYYVLGDIRLRLHADETGILRSIFISK